MSQTPRSLAELFTQYLQGQMSAQAEGLGLTDQDGQVVPHEVVFAQPMEPRLAWADALAVVRHFSEDAKESCWEAPPDWPALVVGLEPAVALTFSLGNYPQLVRNLHPLLREGDLSALRPTTGRPASLSASLLEWTAQARSYPQVLLAAGLLRLTRRFEEAAELLRTHGRVSAEWAALRANEEAALAWHRGQAEEALALWQAQKASVPVLFNLGMAALFLGRTHAAQTALSEAVRQLPDTSAWHHLGQLYWR